MSLSCGQMLMSQLIHTVSTRELVIIVDNSSLLGTAYVVPLCAYRTSEPVFVFPGIINRVVSATQRQQRFC